MPLTEVLDVFPDVQAVVLVLAAVLVGSLVQGSLGFGMGLVAIPLMALVVPQHLPQTVVLVVLPLAVVMLWHERDAVRPRAIAMLLLGRVLGVVPAVVLLAVMPLRALQALFAVTILAGTALMATDRFSVEVTPRNQLVAGTLGGILGTAAAVGSPPVALLYARQSGRDLRATLALLMVVGNVATLIGYGVGGRLGSTDLTLAAVLLIPMLAGLAIGVRLRPYLHGPRLRWAVLTLITVSALVLLARAALG